MKNIQIIDGAENCVYDIFSATDEEFLKIFKNSTDIAFIDEVYEAGDSKELDEIFLKIWRRPVCKREAIGIHGILFYELEAKKKYYPTRKDSEACNPRGGRLR
ncbi:hypothetical protein ACCQ08_21635 [Comamonas sp. SY3]|uniref:hypothetical protein n=1 Tax=Comamonas sp. SY3 TaxID=3243601 RepID=UPI0035942C90